MAEYHSVELQASPGGRASGEDPYFRSPQAAAFYGSQGQSEVSMDKYNNDNEALHPSQSAAHIPIVQFGGTLRGTPSPKKSNKRKWIILGTLALVVLIAIAASLGGVFGSKKSKHKQKFGNGSVITAEDGTKFVYNNTFGGTWSSIPFDNSAQCRSDTKPLSEQWDFSYDRIWGVNLGGWFVLEPFITPALFEPFVPSTGNSTVIDEYTLSQALGSNLSATMTEHYSTFITEKDFAQIAGAGLNWIRLPIPYWFIETFDGEPFLEGVGWAYVLKAIAWARKYGLRIELDLHALPGSQNGQNHSGRIGSINFLLGAMGIANAQRSLNYIRTLAEFISQPQYSPVIPMFAIANEVAYSNIGGDQVKQFYLEAYNMVRGITGIGEGKGPMIAIHDGFVGANKWPGFMLGADRLALETHYYLAYSPDLFITDLANDLSRPCVWWQPGNNASLANFGMSFGGEWCLAINDCGQYINGLQYGSHYGGNYNSTATTPVGDCGKYVNYKTFDDGFKTQLKQLTAMYMDSPRSSFFWSWKMGANSTGEIPNPLWSYQLGVENGWIPTDPKDSEGACQAIPAQLGISAPTSEAWTPPLIAWMTGGVGANTMPAVATANFTQWPPTSLVGTPTVSNLYTYTQTGTPITLSVSTPTATSAGTSSTSFDAGNGWADASDTASWFTAVSGCSYPDAYSGAGMSYPTAPPCQG